MPTFLLFCQMVVQVFFMVHGMKVLFTITFPCLSVAVFACLEVVLDQILEAKFFLFFQWAVGHFSTLH